MEKGEERVQSELERGVLKRLIQAGYRVIPQWKAGYYWIDLVVEGAGKRLAIECDGDRFHPIEKLPQDMARQAILERLGWKFARIRGSQFFRDPDSAMEPIFSRLKSLEIPPEAMEGTGEKLDPPGNALKERVIRRAQELRLKWQEMEFPEEQPDSRRRRSWSKNQGTKKDRNEASEDDPAKQPEKTTTTSPQKQGVFGFAAQGNLRNSQEESEQTWIMKKGAAALRRLHRWAKESGNFDKSDVSLIHWVALDLDKKKPLSHGNARKVKRLWEKAVRKGFNER
jgi:very-short-patch-repair endonuclease